MKHEERRAAVAAYKERRSRAGIYAVRCPPAGKCWVGRTADVGAIRNRLWFTLANGGGTRPAMQAAWNTHGAEAFSFEELERLPDDIEAVSVDRVLKERLAHWRAVLGADPA